jgi:DNA primase
MLLEQNMNVKVLLLPDGEDPDSFARSRNASELMEYMEKNQKDFIKFKLEIAQKETENDPTKRSNLINDILRSISFIPTKETKRSVYIQDCARYFEMEEKKLTEIIEHYIKEREKGNSEEDASKYNENEITKLLNKKDIPFTFLQERELLKHVINYALVPIEFVTPDEVIIVPMVEYVAFMMENGIISFSYDLHNKIWDYILESENGDLRNQFLNHSDKEIQDYTFSLIEDKYEIYKETEDYTPEQLSLKLSSITPQLVHGLELRIIEEKIKKIVDSIKILNKKSGVEDQIIGLMNEQKELNKKIKEIKDKLKDCKQKRLEV